MRQQVVLVLLLALALTLTPICPATPAVHFKRFSSHTAAASSLESNLYWFQVGAWAASENGYADRFGQPVTGASVEIRILDQKLTHADTDDSYWVGLDLPNDAFIQAGYELNPQFNSGHPSWFWEYFLPGTANEGTGGFLGNEGVSAGENGTWVKFSITSSGTIWSTFDNDRLLGKIDLSVRDSGRSGPYASAESAQTYWADNILGPVEFRNLSFRDAYDVWHLATAAVTLCCYSVGSAKFSGNYPYGIEGIPGENNHWLAGSGLQYRTEGQYIWPWYYVNVKSSLSPATGSGWYTKSSKVTPEAEQIIPLSDNTRYDLSGWSDGTDGTAYGFTADGNMTLSTIYVKQYFVMVTSSYGSAYGSGWYDAGSTARIRVTPTSIPGDGILGALGVSTVVSGWGGDYTGSPTADGSSNVKVEAPMMIHAVWVINPGLILPAMTVVVISVVTAFIFHKRRSNLQHCFNCGHKLPKGSAFCLECGRDQKSSPSYRDSKPQFRGAEAQNLTSNKSFCIDCGAELPLDSKFCKECGTKQP